MADDKTGNTPPTDPKPAKSGALRPPVLEGTARPSADKEAARPAAGKPDASAAKPAAGSETEKHAPEAAPRSGSATPWLAGLVGGVVGLAAAYGLAALGLWPSPPLAPAQPDPRIARLANDVPQLQTLAGTVETKVSTLGERITALEGKLDEAAPADPGLDARLTALSQRLNTLETASGAAGAIDAPALGTLRADLDALRAQTATLATQLTQTDQTVSRLGQVVDVQAESDNATARLPLILSGLETAFGKGAPFEAELAALRKAMPELTIPEPLAARAATGLPRPDSVIARFDAAIPAILAGRPSAPDASWQDATANWFRGLIALRPVDAATGSGPDAIVARIEAALGQDDFQGAAHQWQALPAPMQAAAGTIADDIAALAGAEAFLGTLRHAALDMESGA